MQEKDKKPRVLYLQTTPVPPPTDPTIDRFLLLSDHLEGEVLAPIWFTSAEEIQNHLGPDAWPYLTRGSFRYRWSPKWVFENLKSRFEVFRFYILEGLRAHRENPFDCIMCYSHMTTGLCALVLSILTGASLVVEVISSPDRVFINTNPRVTLADRLHKLYSDICLHITMLTCDQVHLLYEEQLDDYPLLSKVPRTVFHEFVPIQAVPRHVPTDDIYILMVGAPWYLKGTDLLVAAFRRMTADYPNVRLRILGHYPDADQLHVLIGGCPQIEVMKARPNPETLQLIADASILVLPSRCEGMGRVLLEAMAAGIPVVGSRVGGIPSLVHDNINGFLFPDRDDRALEVCLRRLLDDPELRDRMGERGREMAYSTFSEKSYIESFTKMIRDSIGA